MSIEALEQMQLVLGTTERFGDETTRKVDMFSVCIIIRLQQLANPYDVRVKISC